MASTAMALRRQARWRAERMRRTKRHSTKRRFSKVVALLVLFPIVLWFAEFERERSADEGDSWSGFTEAEEDLPIALSVAIVMRKKAKRLAEVKKREEEKRRASREFDVWKQRKENKRVDEAVVRAFRQTAPQPLVWPPVFAGRALCTECAKGKRTRCEYLNPVVCNHNQAILDWASSRLSPTHIPLDQAELKLIQQVASRKPAANMAAVLAEQKKYNYMQALLVAAPGLFKRHLLFVVATRADIAALKMLTSLFDGPASAFYRWAWTIDQDEQQQGQGQHQSLLHVCIATGQLRFCMTHLYEPLRDAVGDEQALELLRPHLTLGMAKFMPTQTPIRYALLHRDPMLLPLLARMKFGPNDVASPVFQAAKEIATMPALRMLVNQGASLHPIWRLLRERKLAWLRSLILDAFFEQGLRCRHSRCFIRKISSPDIRAIIVSFLWRGLRKPSSAVASMPDRHLTRDQN